MNRPIYYVYTHEHPIDKTVVYVGMGQKGRAWTITNSGGDNAAYGNRSKDHFNWFLQLEANNFTLDQIVNIRAKGLIKRDALDLEKELISEYRPTFNKVMGTKHLKVTKEMYLVAVAMRDDGLFYHQIAEELGVSAMTVHRALNGQTKNIGEDYGR